MENTAFQWNAGGWFGSQLGGTCWMAIAGFMLLSRDPALAARTLVIFAAVNVIGIAVWMQRSRLKPLPAIQGLVVLAGVSSALVTWVIDSAGQFDTLGVGGQVSARSMYLILALMIPGLLLMFHLIGRVGPPRGDAGSHDN